MAFPPERIVCLTEETVETLYLLGQSKRIVGVTGYAVRPPEVRREKPRVGAFTSADIPSILALKPDLVLTFSDLQADIAAELIKNGIVVHAFNQRSVAGILDMIRTLGALVGEASRAKELALHYSERLDRVAERFANTPKPRVYFEEWDSPRIAGIRWVSDLIGIAGGTDVFRERAHAQDATSRIVEDADILSANPDVIVASWCGKKVRAERIASRDGWDQIAAVQAGRIHEIKSPLILQPGPAALSDGLDALCQALHGRVAA